MNNGRRYLAALAVAIILLTSMVEASQLTSAPDRASGRHDGQTPATRSPFRAGFIARAEYNQAGHPGRHRPSVAGWKRNRQRHNRFGPMAARVSGFDIRTVRQTGIHLLSRNNIVEDNTISGCLDGIRLDRSGS